jgi:RNA polymerase sigma factor for flagellar operon FliA
MSSPAISTASDPAGTFLAHLSLIDRIIAYNVRRHAFSGPDAEDFGAWVKERLMDGDYAILRRFGGRSSLATFLTVVIANLAKDYRNSRWGRWRPSADAKRRGPVAIRLEELLYRDRYPLREAVQTLRSSGVQLDEAELVRLAARLPQRASAREVSLDAVGDETVAGPSHGPTAQDEGTAESRELAETLRALVAELPPEDGLILRMRFWDDTSVADIARALRLEQKPLYRRLVAIEARLRAALEARGINRERVADILTGDSPT